MYICAYSAQESLHYFEFADVQAKPIFSVDNDDVLFNNGLTSAIIHRFTIVLKAKRKYFYSKYLANGTAYIIGNFRIFFFSVLRLTVA